MRTYEDLKNIVDFDLGDDLNQFVKMYLSEPFDWKGRYEDYNYLCISYNPQGVMGWIVFKTLDDVESFFNQEGCDLLITFSLNEVDND